MYKPFASAFTALSLICNALAAPNVPAGGSMISDAVNFNCTNTAGEPSAGYLVDVYENAAFGTADKPYNHSDLDTLYYKSFSINRKGSNLFIWTTDTNVPATKNHENPYLGHIYSDNRYRQVDLRSVVVRHRGYFFVEEDGYYTLTSRVSADDSEIAFGAPGSPQRVVKTQKLGEDVVSITIKAMKGQYVYFSYTTANTGSGPMKWQGDIKGGKTEDSQDYLRNELFGNYLCKPYLEWPNNFQTVISGFDKNLARI